MRQNGVFIVLILLAISGLHVASAWIPEVSDRQEASGQILQESPLASAQRRELLETLDRILVYENYYRSTYHHFTQVLNRIGYSIPEAVSGIYQIQVISASEDQILIQAVSEAEGRPEDRVTVDQNFRVHASFPLPSPRAEFLRSLALKQIRSIKETGSERPLESSIFQGYFRYEIRKDSQGNNGVFGFGIKPPVLGIQMDSESEIFASTDDSLAEQFPRANKAGQQSAANLMTSEEKEFLAQQIFHGEVGRYARDWSELSQIAAFKTDEFKSSEIHSDRRPSQIVIEKIDNP